MSPFLLPYIIADREDLDRLSKSAIEASPDETMMLSPMEEHPHNAKDHQRSAMDQYVSAVSSPQGAKRRHGSSAHDREDQSPAPNHQSVIEHSVSELLFDPDLTFMDSPAEAVTSEEDSPRKTSSHRTLLNETVPEFGPPMEHVSPDRSVVPLDESEIGFSNDLRASMDVGLPSSRRVTDDTSPKPKVKRARTVKVVKPPVDQKPFPPRSSRTVLKKEVPSEPMKLPEPTPAAIPRLPRATKAAAQQISEVKHGPATAPTRSKRKLAEPVSPKATKSNPRPVASTPVADKQGPAQMSDRLRKSPRFASKVLSGNEVGSLMTCPHCNKSYKRARDYEKHLGTCE